VASAFLSARLANAYLIQYYTATPPSLVDAFINNDVDKATRPGPRPQPPHYYRTKPN